MDKETSSKGFSSGMAAKFPLPRASRAHPTTHQSLCDTSTSAHQLARSFFLDYLVTLAQHCCIFSQFPPKAQIRANNLQMELTMHRPHHTWGVLWAKEESQLYLGYGPWRMLPLTSLRKTEAACNTPLFGMERSVQKVLQSTQRSRTPIWLPTSWTVFTALKSYRTQGDVINKEIVLQQLAGLAPAFPRWLFKAAVSCTQGMISLYSPWNMCLPHYHTYFPLLQHFQFCTHLIYTLKFMRHQCSKALEHLMFGQLAAVSCIKNIYFWYLCSITFCCSEVQSTLSIAVDLMRGDIFRFIFLHSENEMLS